MFNLYKLFSFLVASWYTAPRFPPS